MSARRTPRTRGAKPRPRPPKPAGATAELRPFKMVGTLIGAHYDKDGNVVGEEPMGSVTIYAPQFGQFEKLLLQGLADTAAPSSNGVSSAK